MIKNHIQKFVMSVHGSLFKIAKDWKQPICLSTGEWINKL